VIARAISIEENTLTLASQVYQGLHDMVKGDYELTVLDVASRLQVCEDTVRSLLKRGDLEGYKVGQLWRIRANKLEDFIDQAGNDLKRREQTGK